jgi:hypothetical protein
MFNWIRRRRLTTDARKRLLLVAARAEEAIIETHVSNLLDLLETLEGDIDLDHALELYAEMMSLDETMGGNVATRLMARLEAPQAKRRKRRYRNAFRADGEG